MKIMLLLCKLTADFSGLVDNAVEESNRLNSEIAKLESQIPNENYRSCVENEIRDEIGNMM